MENYKKYKKFLVVDEEDNGLVTIPNHWFRISENGQKYFLWPAHIKSLSTIKHIMLRDEVVPQNNWVKCIIKDVIGHADTYEEAEQCLFAAENRSDVDTDYRIDWNADDVGDHARISPSKSPDYLPSSSGMESCDSDVEKYLNDEKGKEKRKRKPPKKFKDSIDSLTPRKKNHGEQRNRQQSSQKVFPPRLNFSNVKERQQQFVNDDDQPKMTIQSSTSRSGLQVHYPKAKKSLQCNEHSPSPIINRTPSTNVHENNQFVNISPSAGFESHVIEEIIDLERCKSDAEIHDVPSQIMNTEQRLCPCCIAANENYKKAIAHIDKTISGLENSIVERIRYFIDLGYAPTVSSTAGGIKTTKSTLTLPVGSNELPEFEKKLVSIPEFRDTFRNYISKISRASEVSTYSLAIMDQVFKQDIGFEYNWFGKKGKKAFKILNVADIITDVIQKANEDGFVLEDVVKSIQKWLTNKGETMKKKMEKEKQKQAIRENDANPERVNVTGQTDRETDDKVDSVEKENI